MAKELPYFKFEPSEWDNGTIQLCDRETKGLFIDLCSMYWSRIGDLPYKLALQKLCTGNASALQVLVDEQIISINDDKIVIDFLEEQLSEFEEVSEKRRLAAEKRWKNANAKQVHSKSNANRREEKREEEKKKEEKIIYPWPTQNFISVWNQWRDYKKEQFRFTYKSSKSEQAALTELNKLAADEVTAIRIIHRSIGNGWKGFFKLENNGQQKNGFTAFAAEQLANDPDYKRL